MRYHFGRLYRCCTYRCAAVVWTKQATERRSRHRAAHRVKQLTCEVCGITFIAARSDARTCSTTCRQRARTKRKKQTKITAAKAKQPVIVTSISRKRARQRRAVYTAGKPDNGPTDDTLMKAMARMVRPPGAG